MNRIHILFYWINLIIIAGIVSCGQPNKEPDDVNRNLSDLVHNPVRSDGTVDSSFLPIMTLESSEYDFGVIEEGEVAQKAFTFRNTGTASLLILKVTSTCGCTKPEWPADPIPPGEEGSILIKFDSKNKEGHQNKQVTIFANTFPNSSHITIKGTVTKSN